MKKAKLIPVDKKRCQAEHKQFDAFMLGLAPMKRCENPPVWIAKENKPNPQDNLRGSMSLCDSCADVLIKKKGKAFCTFTPIKPVKK